MKYFIYIILISSILFSFDAPKNCENNKMELEYAIKGNSIDKLMVISLDDCKKKRMLLLDENKTVLEATWYDQNGTIKLKNNIDLTMNIVKKIQHIYNAKYYADKSIINNLLSTRIIKDFETCLFDYLFQTQDLKILSDKITPTTYRFFIVSIKYMHYLESRGNFELKNIVVSKIIKDLKYSLKNSNSLYQYMTIITIYKYLLETLNFDAELKKLLKIYFPFDNYSIFHLMDNIFLNDIKEMQKNILENKIGTKTEKLNNLEKFKKIHEKHREKLYFAIKTNNLEKLKFLIKNLKEKLHHTYKTSKNKNNALQKSSLYFMEINGIFSLVNEFKKYSNVLTLYKSKVK